MWYAALNAFSAYCLIDGFPVLAAALAVMSLSYLRASIRLARDYHQLRRECEAIGREFPPP